MAIRRQTTSTSASKPKFQYRGHTADEMRRRAQQSGSNRDTFIDPSVKFFTPKSGDNRIRILPPTWPDASHFGYEIFVHYDIGTDGSAYLCSDAMTGEKGVCPVCQERSRADAAGEKEYASDLRAGKRVSVYVIDRDRPQEGVLLWNMPYTIDRDICSRAVDRMTGEVFNIDDPDNGYDINFSREGSKEMTKYVGIDLARRSTPLSDDPALAQRWLDYAIEHPVPSVLVQHDAEHIARQFSGAGSPLPETTVAKAEPARPERVAKYADKPKSLPTWEVVHKYSEEELLALIDAEGIADNLDAEAETASIERLADMICEVLKINPPAAPAAEKGENLKDRLSRLRPRT